MDGLSGAVPLVQATETIPITEALTNVVGDPLSVVSLLFGALFVAAASAVLGYLALGAAVDAVVPENLGEPPRQGA
jgi:hypothetical protein